MKVLDKYLIKHASSVALIDDKPDSNLELIVVIPLFDELDYIGTLLRSIELLERSNFDTEFIFVINDSIKTEINIVESNDKTVDVINAMSRKRESIKYLSLGLKQIESKHAGVGYARKKGMDEAVKRFRKLNKDGIIVCLDADCQVEFNYLNAIYTGFKEMDKMLACSIHYEHPIDGINANDIINYELHLRYFIDIQRLINLPYAHQTVGSSMAVRATAYAKMGGMNQRQAGEDFYFLQKFISIGKTFELNTTTVYPSARQSDRVPFGTGKAMTDMSVSTTQFKTYNYESFMIIDDFIRQLKICVFENGSVEKLMVGLNESLVLFLNSKKFVIKYAEINKHTSSPAMFMQRFFHWFNAFLLMKCLHYLRANGYEDQDVKSQCISYIRNTHQVSCDSTKCALLFFRQLVKQNEYFELAMIS